MTDWIGNPVVVSGFAPITAIGNPVNVIAPRVWFMSATAGGLVPVQMARADESGSVLALTPKP